MEMVFRMIQEVAANGKIRILVFIAGCRKTMIYYYLGFAMRLFGQPWDRITHVIVPEKW